jgi:hypothetical protein
VRVVYQRVAHPTDGVESHAIVDGEVPLFEALLQDRTRCSP